MSKLTHGDIQELTAFFSSTLTAGMRISALAAQSYEPRGQGYQPTTDIRLATLVIRGVRSGRGDWAQMKRVIDELPEAHVEILHLACGGREQIACRTPAAMAVGRRLAEENARMYELGFVLDDARREGCSGIAVAMRVLEADRRLRPRPIYLHDVLMQASRAIAEGLVDVDAETDAVIDAAADAYHAARTLVFTGKRQRQLREEKRRQVVLDLELGKIRAKEAARFERRLRNAS